MPGTLTFDDLKSRVADGSIDTVLVCFVDMQGRLMGKRFHAVNFVETSFKETHCCNYLLATDLEMATPDGYASTSWQAGYGDYIMAPDLGTIRLVPWLAGTAMVLCDLLDHHTHEPVPHSPRAVLKKQIKRLAALGYEAKMATELEFFLFEKSLNEIRNEGFRNLQPISGYNEDYHIFQTTKEEDDYHSIAKHAVKEIAWQNGRAATFMPKWDKDRVGSSSHVHQSLWKDDEAAFYDKPAKHGMSELMSHYMAGLINYAPDYTYFLAPYVNSYKRFARGTFAPTKTVWSVDNRTAGFRLCGENTKGVRVECRIGGSDLNPYLAQAAMLAAGIKGIEDKMKLAPATTGDIYEDAKAADIPQTLRAATETLRKSKFLREALGDDVVDHYTRAAEWEQEEFDRVVTDWEIARGFERA